jgi:hypothetical protein
LVILGVTLPVERGAWVFTMNKWVVKGFCRLLLNEVFRKNKLLGNVNSEVIVGIPTKLIKSFNKFVKIE